MSDLSGDIGEAKSFLSHFHLHESDGPSLCKPYCCCKDSPGFWTTPKQSQNAENVTENKMNNKNFPALFPCLAPSSTQLSNFRATRRIETLDVSSQVMNDTHPLVTKNERSLSSDKMAVDLVLNMWRSAASGLRLVCWVSRTTRKVRFNLDSKQAKILRPG